MNFVVYATKFIPDYAKGRTQIPTFQSKTYPLTQRLPTTQGNLILRDPRTAY